MTDKSAATIDVSYEDGVVTVAVHGRLTSEVGDEVMRRSAAALRNFDALRMLHDLRRARLAETTLQLIRRPRFATELAIPNETRTALLCSVRTPDLEFLESIAANNGRTVRVFTDGATALAWLKSE
jgi:stage V sporulation protein SpoVS